MDQRKRWYTIVELSKTDPHTYRDFEGLAEPDKVIETVKDIAMPLNDMQRDIVLNIVYEYVDEGTGEMPSEDLLYMIAHTVHELTTCPRWMKTGIVWEK